MKRLCVFYKNADLWCGRLDVEWIVCKGCQRKLRSGEMMPPMSSSVGKARRYASRSLSVTTSSEPDFPTSL